MRCKRAAAAWAEPGGSRARGGSGSPAALESLRVHGLVLDFSPSPQKRPSRQLA